MDYQILPIGDIWANGMFNVPSKIATNYIKLASEYQLKALLLVLSNGGKANGKFIAKSLGCTEDDANDFLTFWVEEGVIACNGVTVAPSNPVPDTVTVKKVQSVPVPTLSPKDIVSICRDSRDLTELLRNAQEVLGKTLSHSEQEMIINMATYYGLPSEIVLVILQYTKAERDNGRALGNAYIATMAKNWSEEGITTLDAADEKLKDLENTNRLWNQIVEISGIRHKNPTQKQREMIKKWADNFNIDMIALACDAMKENADKPTLKYVDGVLKNWHKKGIKTPDDVRLDNDKHNANKDKAKPGKLKSAPNFDIGEIEKNAMFNDDYDI